MQITIDTKHDKPEDIAKAIKLIQRIVDHHGLGTHHDNINESNAGEHVDEQSIIDLANDDSSPFAQPASVVADTNPEPVPSNAPANAFVDMFAPEPSKTELSQKNSAELDSSADIDPALLQKSLSENSIIREKQHNSAKIKPETSTLSILSSAELKPSENDDEDDDKDEDWGPRTKMTLADLERY